MSVLERILARFGFHVPSQAELDSYIERLAKEMHR